MLGMAKTSPTLLQEIEAFLAENGMGASYFGKRAVGNSELVSRLRGSGRIWPETEAKVRSFMLNARANIRNSGVKSVNQADQPRRSNPAKTDNYGKARA